MPKSHLLKSLILLALGLHVVWVGTAWNRTVQVRHGRDFASYYYAFKSTQDGGNPYSKEVLGQYAKKERTRSSVHPYLYPPPFLLMMEWTRPLSLQTSFRLWFWFGELAALAALLAMCRWVRPLGPGAVTLCVIGFSVCTAVPNNHAMGQANFFVLLAVILAFVLESEKRSVLAGVLLGLGILMKISPALLLVFWVVERRWKACIASVLTGIVGHLLVFFMYGSTVIEYFYFEVFPGFSAGQYNGLRVPIEMFGNHSLPNLWHQWMPGTGQGLSMGAQWASRVTSLVLVVATLWVGRTATSSRFSIVLRWSSILLMMLLIPVYTYEHHLIWAMPAVAITALAVIQGRVPLPLFPILGLAWMGWAFSLARLKQWAQWCVQAEYPMSFAWLLQEWKTFSCIILWIGLMGLIRQESRDLRFEGKS